MATRYLRYWIHVSRFEGRVRRGSVDVLAPTVDADYAHSRSGAVGLVLFYVSRKSSVPIPGCCRISVQSRCPPLPPVRLQSLPVLHRCYLLIYVETKTIDDALYTDLSLVR